MTDFVKSFWNKTVNGLQITDADLPANFQDATVIGIDFSGKSLNDSSFVNATVQDCDFSNCDLKGVNFFDAKLINCNFTGATIWANGPVSWHTTFPDDVSGCVFDSKGLDKLRQLDKISEAAKQRAKDWMDRHPVRQQWVGDKLDSPWHWN